VIRKSVADPRRARAHLEKARAGRDYEERDGALRIRRASLRELHGQKVAARAARP
jgi:hypothetical protein